MVLRGSAERGEDRDQVLMVGARPPHYSGQAALGFDSEFQRGGWPQLPAAVRLLQPILRCWTGTCQTCAQPIDISKLVLFHRRE